ncbi:MAG: EamA family transporter, partial [Chloroflexota bacterium]
MLPPSPDPSEDRRGMAAALAAAIIYGAAYPATAVALRSFSPLAVAGLSCTLALVVVTALAAANVLPRPSFRRMSAPRLVRLTVLSLLGGIVFIAGINAAVAIAGPTITGFVAPLYAIFG